MKPNWPLIAILAGFAATLTIVLVIVLSPPTFVGPELPTIDSSVDEAGGDNVQATLVRDEQGCFFVTVDGERSYAIWPSGFARDGETVTNGTTTLADGNTFTATGIISDRATAVGDNEYLNRVTGSCMGADSDASVIVMSAVG